MTFVRHCPRCRSDYRPEIARCAECGDDLVDRFEGVEAPAPEEPPPPPMAPPPGRYESIYFSHAAADLAPLAGRLARRRIPFRIETAERGLDGRPLTVARYELQVREAERQTAREELLELLAEGSALEGAHLLDRDFDPEAGYRSCPGCATALVAGSPECPECGLVLADPEGRGPE